MRLPAGIIGLMAMGAGIAGAASVPQLVNYQGRLTNPAGQMVADGTQTINFSIYDNVVGGALIWGETQPVYVAGGVFNVLLGSVVPITSAVFNSDQRWLASRVSGENEMQPRQRIASGAFALNADTLDGQHSSNFLDTSATGQTKSGDLTVQGKLGTTDSILMSELSGNPSTPAAGKGNLHYKNDKKLYYLDSSGNQTLIAPSTLGYAETAVSQNNIQGTETDLTGLTVTVNVPAGQRIRITGYFGCQSGTTGARMSFRIKEGSTMLAASYMTIQASGGMPGTIQRVFTPTAGSHTYKLALVRDTGNSGDTVGFYADGTTVAYLLVEAI